MFQVHIFYEPEPSVFNGCGCRDGQPGRPGRDGKDGQSITGPAGKDGINGLNGRDGKAGTKGEKGEPGPPGKVDSKVCLGLNHGLERCFKLHSRSRLSKCRLA